MEEASLRIEQLDVTLPNGEPLFRGLDLTARAGEVVAILGASGAGKSTLGRVLFQRQELLREGFEVSASAMEARGGLGLVPQRGALFDHLDVAGNIALAQRQAGTKAPPESVERWLEAVDLPLALARAGTPVARLSGGQAQRVAVARTLASGQHVIFCDEPSVGLDPLRVSALARLLRATAERGSALIVVTHDLELAAEADRVLFLDGGSKALSPLGGDGWRELDTLERRALLDRESRRRLASEKSVGEPPPTTPERGWWPAPWGAFATVGGIATSLSACARLGRAAWHVFAHAAKSAALRPAPFYLIVSAILGYTVLYVISRALPAGLRADRAVELVGGAYIIALTPPLSALVFAATSGSAVSAWLGSMGLTGQVTALRALGISRAGYLDTPAWLALLAAYLLTALIFTLGMTLGGAALCFQVGLNDPWPLLLGDVLDPHPSRWMLRQRAFWLVGIYSLGIAAEVVHRATRPMRRSEDITRAMTTSVILVTLWVVVLELLSAAWVFSRTQP